MNRLAGLSAGAVLMSALAQTATAGVIATFSDQVAWAAAVNTIAEETFDGAASSFAENTSGNDIGLLSLDLIGGIGDPGPTGLTGTGFLQGELDASDPVFSDGLTLQFNRLGMFGFGLVGLQNETAASGLSLEEIGIEVAGERFLVSDILGLSDPLTPGSVGDIEGTGPVFVGVVLDSAVDSFSLIHGDLVRPVSGNNEHFYLEGVVVASSAATPLPAPTTLALVSLGLAGLRLRGHREAV